MTKVSLNSIHVLEEGQLWAAALGGGGESNLPKYMMEVRFSHKTGHIMYHRTKKSGQTTLGRL